MILKQFGTMNKTLYPQDWEYLAEGEVHFIVKYVGVQSPFTGKVLRIKKEKNETQLERGIDSLSATLFNKYLQKVGLFSPYFIDSTIVGISEAESQQFLECMWKKLQSQSKSQKKTEGIDRLSQIELMDNLTSAKDFKNYTCLIQIKPKSPIYDKYEEKTLFEIAQENNLTQSQLQSLIENLPEEYKIQRIKRGIISDKPHNNQIESCKFFRGELMNYLDKNKSLIEMYFKESICIERSSVPVSELELNKAINGLLHKEDIFNKLLAPIYLYPKSHSRLNGISKETILQMLCHNDYSNFVEELVNQTLENYQKKSFQQSNNPIDNTPIHTSADNQLYQLLEFLISSTFRDVSLLMNIEIRAKQKEDPIQINQEYSAVYRLVILDYEMKSMYRVREKYLNEDNTYLREFVPMMLKRSRG